jgi:hypothetical protein
METRLLRYRFLGLLSAAAGSLAACTSRAPGTSRAPAPEQPRADVRVADCDGPASSLAPELRATLQPRNGRLHPDDHWADLAEKVPGGFAGVLYVDGKPTLMLTHPEQATDAKRALTSALSLRSFPIMDAQVLKARWDFAQLVDWYNYLSQRTSLWATPGIVSGDNDERINRIRLGIQTEAGRQELVGKLKALRIPCDLIRIGIEALAQVL